MKRISRLSQRNHVGRKPRRLDVEPLEARQLLAGVVFNELHYDHPDASVRGEFVELYNSSAATVDISGWVIDKGVDFTFPASSSIGPGQYLVIAQSSVDFESEFGFAPFGEWETGDKLSNDGERIELLDSAGVEIDTLRYRLGFPWPTPDEGQSIELINPEFDNTEGSAWQSAGASAPLVEEGAIWTYRKGITNNPPADWNEIGFDTSTDNVTWQTGPASIGYGDGDDETLLSDMRNNYSTVYFRHDFTLSGAIPSSLAMRLYVDDGAIIYVNGTEITRRHVNGGAKDYNSTGNNHEAVWEDVTLTGLGGLLVEGTNTLAVHGLNQAANSSDFSFDAELRFPGTSTTPGSQNSSFALNSPPFIEDVEHSILEPVSGEDVIVTAKIDDLDGVESASVEYQLVEPGDYIAIDDPRYATQWTSIAMNDDGVGGDEVAGDGTWSATLMGNLQAHRQLVRYRVVAEDGLMNAVTVPYADDPTPNFAYYVYDGVPDWTGADRPGVTSEVTYSGETLSSVATYQLITTQDNHVDAQHIPDSDTNSYSGSDYRWEGTLVYDGKVYDHIRYRARGGVWRYAMGKNMWKFDFNKGQDFYAKDNYGDEYDVGWSKLNLGANIQQGDFWHRGEQGLFESVGFRLFDLAGVEAPNANYVQFRIVSDSSETGADQYSGDFQGLYLAIEQLDGNFLDEHGLPDGNLYKMENGTGVGGIGGDSNNQGDWPEVTDSSDLIQFKTTYESGAQSQEWWEANLDLESYYSYRSIVEAIHHYDIGFGKNYFYYHNPETGKWQTVPWDLDLTWADNMFGNGAEPFRDRVLAISEFAQDYRSRMREVRDLLYNTDQTSLIIDEYAALVDQPGIASLVEADRAMWDYNPILTSSYVNSSKAGHGLFYAGNGRVIPATGSFAGMAQRMKDYVDTRGDWIDQTILNDDNVIPNTPTIDYTGVAGFPVDSLQFTASAFSDRNGTAFGAMEWRVAEVANPSTPGFDPDRPWIYEIDSVWESGELTTFDDTVSVSSSELSPGKTYRARVRMMDADGNWGHWSEPLSFVAGAPDVADSLVVTELHYHPLNDSLDNESDQEFVEFLNVGATALDLSGFQIVDFASTAYTFEEGTTLEPGQYLVVARTPSVFQAVYPAANVLEVGYANSNLGNSGDTLTILTADGSQVLSFTYDDAAPWPTASDGDGPSLEVIDPLGDLADPLNWRASAVDGGTPGRSSEAGIAGDYDRNGVVEEADRVVWVSQFGSTVLNPGDGADGNGDFFVDAADFTIWRDNLVAALAAQAAASVVEPWVFDPTTFVGPLLPEDWQSSEQLTATREKAIALAKEDQFIDAAVFAVDSSWWLDEDEDDNDVA